MKPGRADWLLAAYIVVVGLVIILDLSPPLWGAGLIAPLSGAVLWRASRASWRATLAWTAPLALGAPLIAVADQPAATLLIAGLQGAIVILMQWQPAFDRWVSLVDGKRDE